MESKSDDSAGSDSLDKTLQAKCVVADLSPGDGQNVKPTVQQSNNNDTGNKSNNMNSKSNSNNSACSIGGGGGATVVNTNENKRPEAESGAEGSVKRAKTALRPDCVGEGGAGECGGKTAAAALPPQVRATTTGAAATGGLVDQTQTAPALSTLCLGALNRYTNFSMFEQYVQQLTQGLRGTSLSATTTETGTTATSTTTTSSTAATATTTEITTMTTTGSAAATSTTAAPTMPPLAPTTRGAAGAGSSAATAAAGSAPPVESGIGVKRNSPDDFMCSSSSSSDFDPAANNTGHRSKKVRFHPDVKENDGGNRIMPKKKKKRQTVDYYNRPATGNKIDGLENYEEDWLEEEEEFDVERTMKEAHDYLESHPLTFARPSDKNAGQLPVPGLLQEEDMPHLSESSDEDECVEPPPAPENGVECILGKLIRNGKVGFLLRYACNPGIFWESEEVIFKYYPKMLLRYERNRERLQDRLMRHVGKRQAMRQRYTDF